MYNSKYKILFSYNPLMQCILGKFDGWQMVLEAFNDTRTIKKDDPVLFTYSAASQFNKLFKHIKNHSQ